MGLGQMSTVLVVDDEERVRAFLSRALSFEGHTVVTAGDGVQALQRLEPGDVDLVLLDVMMPRCNGMEVLTQMARRRDTTPVIVLSAVTDVSTRVQSLDRGAVDSSPSPSTPRRWSRGCGVISSRGLVGAPSSATSSPAASASTSTAAGQAPPGAR